MATLSDHWSGINSWYYEETGELLDFHLMYYMLNRIDWEVNPVKNGVKVDASHSIMRH